MVPDKTSNTIAAYNNCAESYTKKFLEYPTYKEKLKIFQNLYIRSNSTILDLGCGPGNNGRHLMSQDPTLLYTGVDLSEKFLEIAKQHIPNGIFKKVDLRKNTITQVFDCVLASFCIVHLTSEEAIDFIKALPVYLVKDGSLYLSFMEGKVAGFETTSFSTEELYLNYFKRQSIVQQLEDAGFIVQSLSSEEYPEANGTTTSEIFIFATLP